MSTKYDISELVEQFSYQDLSKEDRARVDQEIGQETYEEMYDAIHLFQAVDSDIQPKTSELPVENTKTVWWKQVLLYPVPLYAFLMLCGACAVVMWQGLQSDASPRPEMDKQEQVIKAGTSIQEGMYPDELIIEI